MEVWRQDNELGNPYFYIGSDRAPYATEYDQYPKGCVELVDGDFPERMAFSLEELERFIEKQNSFSELKPGTWFTS